MKRFWPYLVAVVALTSCTPVEDFGAYWDKGFIDPALEGSWKKIGLPGEDIRNVPGPDMWRFTKHASSYSLQAINPLDDTAKPDVIERRKADNERVMSARTLRIANHLFLMQRDDAVRPSGRIHRYDVQGEVLHEYSIANGAAVDFLRSKHPAAKNIRKNTGEGEYVVIGTFDDEVFQVLSEIADDPTYWYLSCQYRKVP
jgi:hypothetical protein